MCHNNSMSRHFKTANYPEVLDSSVRLGDCLPQNHLAHFLIDIIEQLDLSAFYARYGSRGGSPYSPEILLALLFYAYCNGVFSSRKIEQACRDTVSYRYLAGNFAPDHDTIAAFRKSFLPQLQELFVQILLLAQQMGLLKIGNVSIDGTKIHADASKSKAVSYKRLLQIEAHLREEVAQLFALAEAADKSALPEGMDLPQEIARREDRLQRLAEAKAILQARAAERQAVEEAEYAAKLREREALQKRTGKKLGGRPPLPPSPEPKDQDQYNFTDPDSHIMKNSRDQGFDQHYNCQGAVDQESLLLVGHSLSNHANDTAEAEPTLQSVPEQLGRIAAAIMDRGFFSDVNLTALEVREIEGYIATGPTPHHRSWQSYFEAVGDPPPQGASPREQMAYKLRTALGKALYRRRKCTIEPVIGQIKEAMGFRQFSLRGMAAAAGEWCLVCLAYNLRRLHVVCMG
jgi:transposase